MVTLAEIRDDIVDESKSLTSILRKAKILAYKLGNKDFKSWIEWELTGYYSENVEVPKYRQIEPEFRADGFSGFYQYKNYPLEIPDFLKNIGDKMEWRQGIPQIERFHNEAKREQYVAQPLSIDLIQLLNKVYQEQHFQAIYAAVPRSFLIGILETVHDRLLSFILELETLYPDNESVFHPQSTQEIQRISHLVQNHIFVSNGGNFQMSQFDQREQQVSGNQYNAGHDINIGDIRTKDDLADALSHLREQVEQIPAESEEDADAISDVKYHLEKASIEAKKSEPNKATIKSRIQNAMTVATSASVLTGLVINLDKVVAILDKLF